MKKLPTPTKHRELIKKEKREWGKLAKSHNISPELQEKVNSRFNSKIGARVWGKPPRS